MMLQGDFQINDSSDASVQGGGGAKDDYASAI